jgi:hypothetical protein
LRKLAFFATVIAFFALPHLAAAQQGDAMLGFGTVMSPGAAECSPSFSSSLYEICPEKGGFYPNISADVIFHHRIGVGFDAVWRGGQGLFGSSQGQPYRPILYDFNAVYQPRITKKVGLDLMGGIGWQSTRFYGFQATASCEYFYACYTSSNHFLVDVGGGLRYYVWGHVFVRPEAHYYNILNNTDVFTSGNVIRVGASIGYTIGPD